MMTKRKPTKPSAEKAVRDIRRAIRRTYSAEEKVRIVMEGLRAEESIATKKVSIPNVCQSAYKIAQ